MSDTPSAVVTPPPSPRYQLRVLDHGLLDSLANNGTFLKEFPFLNVIRATKGTSRCGACRSSNRASSDAYAKVKESILGMSSDAKRKFKDMLSSKQVRILRPTAGGRVATYTF